MRILSSIVLVAAAANVGSALAPHGKTRRAVLFAVSLATLLALLLPLLSALGDLPDPPAPEEEDAAAFDPSAPVARAAEPAEKRLDVAEAAAPLHVEIVDLPAKRAERRGVYTRL